MKRFMLLMAATAAMMSSCSKNEVVENPTDPANAIGFSTYVGNSTKADAIKTDGDSQIYTTETLKDTGFGVLGYYTKQVEFASDEGGAKTTPNFMYNQHVEYDATDPLTEGTTAWYYTPIKYYSNTDGDKYSFFAYAPYDDDTIDNGIVLSGNSVMGAPTVTFTLADDVTNLVDFVATQKIDEEKPTTADAPVNLLFKHQLTRLNFSAKTDYSLTGAYDQGNTYVVIKSMKIQATTKFWKSATYTFATTDGANGTWSYDKSTTAAALDFTTLLNKITPTASTTPSLTETGDYAVEGVYVKNDKAEVSLLAGTGDNYLFLIPIDDMKTGDVKIDIVYDILTEDDGHLANKYTVSNNFTTISLIGGTMRQGVAYDYTLTFGLDEVVVSATVAGWDDATNSGNITIN